MTGRAMTDNDRLDALEQRLNDAATDAERGALIAEMSAELQLKFRARLAHRKLIHGDPQYRYSTAPAFMAAMAAAQTDDDRRAILADASPTLRSAFAGNAWWLRPGLSGEDCASRYLKLVAG